MFIFDVLRLSVQGQGRRSASGESTTGIHLVFRELKSEPEAVIEQISGDFEKGRFAKISKG